MDLTKLVMEVFMRLVLMFILCMICFTARSQTNFSQAIASHAECSFSIPLYTQLPATDLSGQFENLMRECRKRTYKLYAIFDDRNDRKINLRFERMMTIIELEAIQRFRGE